MGFFSRIKKLWDADPHPTQETSGGGPEEILSPAGGSPETVQAENSAAPETVRAAEERPAEAPESPEPDFSAEPERGTDVNVTAPDEALEDTDKKQEDSVPQTTPPEEARSARPEPSAPPRAKGGWREFFGFGAKAPEKREEPGEPVLFQEKPSAERLEPWQQNLLQALEGAEPRLSAWMTHLLAGVEKRGEPLWNRLRFLFARLEVPAAESEDFIRRFDAWLQDMEYDHVDEFRSELQYRMALALELEDEEDERDRLFLKLSAGLDRTRAQLTMRIDQLLAMAGGYDDAFWEELEEILLMADVGVNATQELFKRLKPRLRQSAARDAAEFKALLKEEMAAVFVEPAPPVAPKPLEVILMVGVNGAGKTTTIAKLAHRAQMQGRKVLVAAGDTFRAAAIEQLQVWSRRIGAGFYAKGHGSDPAAVAFEAVDYAMKEGYDLLFVDTAGRLQTKHNLMEELKKINRVLGKKLEGAPHRTVLVLDATTGQNALSQVRIFSQAAPVTEVILTKLDGTAKGGIIVAIALEFGLPISFVGLGEKMEDLRPFSGQEFVNALFD